MTGAVTGAITPATAACFTGLVFHDLDIRYSVANSPGSPSTSSELIITNYEPTTAGGGLF